MISDLNRYVFKYAVVTLFLAIPFISNGQSPVLIYNEYNAGADTIDMGMCNVGDSLETIFNIENRSSEVLQIALSDYTFAIEAIGDPIETFEFSGSPPLPHSIQPNSTSEIKIKYNAHFNIQQFPPGKKVVRLRLGVIDTSKVKIPTSFNDLVKYREFILIARKSVVDFDVYEKSIDFDSVWKEPVDTIRKVLVFQNNTFNKVIVDSTFYSFRSLNAEIWFEKQSLPIEFDEYKTIDSRRGWQFKYYPMNTGKDSAVFSLRYHPDPSNPDSFQTIHTPIRGVGVEQKILLDSVEGAEIIEGFIDLGSLPLDTSKEVKIFIRNNGNLPFGFINQKIVDYYYTEKQSDGFFILDSLQNKRNLLPTEIDSFAVVFQPTRRDTILAKIVFTTNLPLRKVWGYPNSAKQVVFNIRGVGIAPKLAADVDSIDLGNIIINNFEGCPTIRDTVVKVFNNGNFVLRVNNVVVEPPYPGTPFKIFEENFDIPPNSSKRLRIVFDSIATETGEYAAWLVLTSNFSKMSDTLRIKLKARGVLPDPIRLSIPNDAKVKPGTVLALPILVERDKVARAKEYQDTIIYNPSILRYRNFSINATASERAEEVKIEEQQPSGKLSVYIRTRWNETFLKLDTLVLLNFDTFVGNEISTPFKFLTPRFGDGICSRVLLPRNVDGTIYLDSLCGLRYKLFDGSKGFFRLSEPSPNPTSEYVEIDYEVAFETKTKIAIYNSYGEIVETVFDGVAKPGVYHTNLSLKHLPRGVYFIRMQAGIFNEVKHFIVSD